MKRIARRVFQRHQCRRLAHLLLFQLLKISGKSTALLSQIQRTESGRPYFLDERIDFNISHSGDWVAVILDIRNEEKSVVGIDIEFPKIRNFTALMEHIAPKEEIDWFHHQQDSLKAFLSLLVFARGCIEISRIWDRKIIQCSSFP